MVISDKYKYLFVELPYTGTTAISKELCENYGGKRILSKHARYHEFLEIANNEQKKYFTFSCIRNPMDAVVSDYLKIKNNHKGRYTNPAEWQKNGGTLTDKRLKIYKDVASNKLDFEQYFQKYFKLLPYDNWSRLAHKKMDYIIYFEHLQQGFSEVLKKLNIEQVRELPQVNKTADKANFINYFTPIIQQKAIFIFSPFMKKWGYTFPNDWNIKTGNRLSSLIFEMAGKGKYIYWKQSKSKSTKA